MFFQKPGLPTTTEDSEPSGPSVMSETRSKFSATEFPSISKRTSPCLKTPSAALPGAISRTVAVLVSGSLPRRIPNPICFFARTLQKYMSGLLVPFTDDRKKFKNCRNGCRLSAESDCPTPGVRLSDILVFGPILIFLESNMALSLAICIGFLFILHAGYSTIQCAFLFSESDFNHFVADRDSLRLSEEEFSQCPSDVGTV